MIIYIFNHINYKISNFTETFLRQNMNKLLTDGMRKWNEDNYVESEYTKHTKLGVHIGVNHSGKGVHIGVYKPSHKIAIYITLWHYNRFIIL